MNQSDVLIDTPDIVSAFQRCYFLAHGVQITYTDAVNLIHQRAGGSSV